MIAERDSSAAIEAVYRRSYGKFLRVAVAILRDEGLAEEAVHDAFVRALRHRRTFARRGPLEAWLWRITVNEACRGRAANQREQLASQAAIGLIDASPANGNGHAESSGVELLLAALPERQRLTLFLRYYADLDYGTIANALGVKPGTVAATLHAAHAALRSHLQEVER